MYGGVLMRNTRDDVLQGRRLGLYETIRANPGLGLRELCRLSNIANGTVAFHVAVLQRFDLVWDIRHGAKRRLFVGNRPADDVALLLARRAALKGDLVPVLAYVAAHPGCDQKAVLDAFPTRPRSSMQHSLARLRDAGFVVQSWSGRHHRLTATPTGLRHPGP